MMVRCAAMLCSSCLPCRPTLLRPTIRGSNPVKELCCAAAGRRLVGSLAWSLRLGAVARKVARLVAVKAKLAASRVGSTTFAVLLLASSESTPC